MRAKIRWHAAVAILLLLAIAAHLLLAIIGLAVVAVVYVVGVRLHPRTSHRGCRGTGRHVSRLFPWSVRRCRGCGGRGQVVRLGARVAGMPHERAEHTAQVNAVATARRARTWR